MTRARTFLALAAAVLAALPVVAIADEGPMIIANQEKHPYLTLDPVHGAIGVTGLYEQDNNRSGGQSAKSTDLLLTQDLTLSTGGAIVSRNLATWTAGGTLSLDEEWTTGSNPNEIVAANVSQTQSQSGIFDTYDLQLNALPTTAYPFSIYANRNENLIDRPFAAMLRDISTTYGANFHLNTGMLPSTLSISHNTSTQSGLDGDAVFTIDQNDLDYGTSFQPTERQILSLNYHYATINQSNPGLTGTSSELQSVSASHNWNIDGAGRYALTQNFDYSTQAGNYPFNQMRLGEQLRLRFSRSLDGAVNYAYESRDYPDNNSTKRNSVSATLTHRLFSSLITTARAGASWSQNSYAAEGEPAEASTADYFGDLTLSYQKKVLVGRLGANFNVGYDMTDNGAIGVPQQVLGEVRTFTDPQPITLTRPGISASSIALFDATGTRQFVQGIDYSVRTVGRTVQISRIIGAAINASDSVRLNYIVGPLPGYTTTSTSVGAGVNYLFEEGPFAGLNPFVRYSQVDQSITPDAAGITPDSVTDLAYGLEYRLWKLTFRAEDETRTSTLAPYDAQRFSLRYDDRIGDRTLVSMGAAQNYMQYPSDDSKTSLTTFDGRLQYEITRGLTSTFTARWRDENDSRIGSITGLEGEWELRWKIRQTEIFGLVRYTQLDSQDSSEDSVFLQFGISRSF